MAHSQERFQSIADAACQHANERRGVPGLVFYAADRQGTELAHVAAGLKDAATGEKMDKDAIFWIASCTKLVTVVAALQLVEQGKLGLNDDAAQYLPELERITLLDGSKPKASPTVWNLLTHTGGHVYPFILEASYKWYEQRGIDFFGGSLEALEGPIAFEPGQYWAYGLGIDWVGKIVERISGLDLEEYFKRNIFEPLGIKDITFYPGRSGLQSRRVGMTQRQEDGTFVPSEHWLQQDETKLFLQSGGGGLYASAKQYTQILVALLNKGTHPNGGRILKPETVDKMLEPQLDDRLAALFDGESQPYDRSKSNPASGMGAPGLKKNWSFAGLRILEPVPFFERSASGVTWSGVANLFWWIDYEDGTCGFLQAQIGPFNDPDVVQAWIALESEVHKAVKQQ
ncbi:hypothetical protein ACQY0O_004559 [Thecaphora frezii]